MSEKNKYLTIEQSAWFKKRVEELFGTMEKAARAMNLPNGTVYKALTGRTCPSVKNARIIEKHLMIQRFPVLGEKIIALKTAKAP